MLVEDAFLTISQRLILSRRCFRGKLDTEWYRSFIPNVAEHITAGRPLSTQQSDIVLSIIRKVADDLRREQIPVDQILRDPVFRHPPYQSIRIPREVRYIGNGQLAFRCKKDAVVTAALKSVAHQAARFDPSHKVWIVPVLRDDLDAIRNLIERFHFQADQECLEFLNSISTERGQSSNAEQRGEIIIVTVRDNDLLAAWIENCGQGLAL